MISVQSGEIVPIPFSDILNADTGKTTVRRVNVNSDGYRNVAISSATWQSGSSHLAFRPYTQTDSPYVDPIDGQVGRTEWYGRWVLVLPVR